MARQVPLGLRARLSAMMFLQSFGWGAWYVTAPNYLGAIGFKPTDIGWVYSVGPIAGMISPLFIGLIIDRYFSAEKVLGALSLLAAAALMAATLMMRGREPSPMLINCVFFIYMLALYPTLALVATLAMRHLADPQRSFPGIRVCGTIGWIAAGLVLSASLWEKSIAMFYLSAAITGLNGLYSFTLPYTPPLNRGQSMTWRQLIGGDALYLLRDRSYLVFLVSSALICIPAALYYQIASRVVQLVQLPVGLTMSYGQMTEIVFMLAMPLFFIRLGVKWMLAVGMIAWVVRYALLDLGASGGVPWVVVVAIALQGVSYDFFFVTGQIYTNQVTPAPIRGQAQAFLLLCTVGLGMALGAQLGGFIEQRNTPPASVAYGQQAQLMEREIATLQARAVTGTDAAKTDFARQIAAARQSQATAQHGELETKDWHGIFLLPTAFCSIILIIFLYWFPRQKRMGRDEPKKSELVETTI